MNRKPIAATEEAQFFERCHTVLSSMDLVSFGLHGEYVSNASLSQFLERTSARRLTLEGVRMRNGVFADIFEVLRSRKFNYLHFDDIWEYRNAYPDDDPPAGLDYLMLHFNVLDRAKFSVGGTPVPGPGCGEIDRYRLFPVSKQIFEFERRRERSSELAVRSGDYDGPSEIIRQGSDISLQLPCFFLAARPLESGDYLHWLYSDKYRFGHPDLNFVEGGD